MINLLVRSLDVLARLFYFAGRNRPFRMGVLACCALSVAGMAWSHSARAEDVTVYPTTVKALRATLRDRYVRISGQLETDGVLEVPATFALVLSRVLRFVPLTDVGAREPFYVLDEGLPSGPARAARVTLVGKVLSGDDPQPSYYLKVTDPPNPALFGAVNSAGIVVVVLVLAGVLASWLVRRTDYAISIPFGIADARTGTNALAPQLLWFGSLGAGYGDVVLRQVPVSFKAIPAEARLTPAGYPDLWSVTIRKPRLVLYTTVATSYGPLPAMRMEFEDERGILRNGLVAVSNDRMRESVLDVLRFVGR
jgi:hypothetical protein